MYYDTELWDKVVKAPLYFKESDESFTKICDIKNVNPTFILDKDDSMDYLNYILKQKETYRLQTQIDDLDKSMADWYANTVFGYKVICTTIKHQNRTHHKYRTNKKWAKRYGYTYVEVQNEPIILIDNTIYCTKDGLDQIKKACNNKK